MHKGTKRTCPKGHIFYKSSDCPTCPTCAQTAKKKHQSDFPPIGAPALRALHAAGITTLKQVSRWRKDDVAGLHGIGPKALQALHRALTKNALSFKD